VRCFVALGLEDGPAAALAGWLEQVRQDVAELTVTPTENLHLTLAFLGKLDEAAVAAAGIAVRLAAAASGEFEVGWSEGGVFPSRSRPRVLWLGVDGGEPLLRAHRALAEALAGAGLPVEERTFRPHLTLARVRRGEISRQRYAEIVGRLATLPAVGPSRAVSMILYESRLGGGPAVHVPLVVERLGG
jgi:2'-5' RNA ligase